MLGLILFYVEIVNSSPRQSNKQKSKPNFFLTRFSFYYHILFFLFPIHTYILAFSPTSYFTHLQQCVVRLSCLSVALP